MGLKERMDVSISLSFYQLHPCTFTDPEAAHIVLSTFSKSTLVRDKN